MAYSTVAQISAEFRNITIAATGTAIVTADVNEWIAEADALINSFVGKRYTTPITVAANPNSFYILRMISRELVAARIIKVLRVKNAASGNNDQDVRKDDSDRVLKMLKDISNGDLELPDATVTTSGQGISSFNVSNAKEPFFDKDIDQW
jgi:phage gp36-like protein